MAIRVLVVDHSATVLYAVCQLLERHGIETLQSRCPIDALTDHLVDNHDIDVVITDILMPGILPAEHLVWLIQQQPSLGFVPVIVLSSHTEKQTQLRFAELGAGAFLPKPWDNDILVATVRMLATDYQRRCAARAATAAK